MSTRLGAGDLGDVRHNFVGGCPAGNTPGFGFRPVVVLRNASKVVLDDVLGGDGLARGTFANRNHDTFLPSRRCHRDKGNDRNREGVGRGNADHESNRPVGIDKCPGAGELRTPRGLYFYACKRSSGLEIHCMEKSNA